MACYALAMAFYEFIQAVIDESAVFDYPIDSVFMSILVLLD